MIPAARLEGDRVVLRDFAPRDVDPFLQAFADESALDRLIGYEEEPTKAWARKRMREEANERIDGRSVRFAIAAPDNDAFLGQIALHSFSWMHRRADCGFMVVPGSRRGGVALEALRLIVRWAFATLGLHRVGLATLIDNEPTIRLAERAGFQREGVLRAYTYERGARIDNLYYGAVEGDPAWA